MNIDQEAQDKEAAAPAQQHEQDLQDNAAEDEIDGLKGKKPEDLTPEELRLMADTMPGEGPGD
jgi:hypothetical protein